MRRNVFKNRVKRKEPIVTSKVETQREKKDENEAVFLRDGKREQRQRQRQTF
jgi:hypothetical protein